MAMRLVVGFALFGISLSTAMQLAFVGRYGSEKHPSNTVCRTPSPERSGASLCLREMQ